MLPHCNTSLMVPHIYARDKGFLEETCWKRFHREVKHTIQAIYFRVTWIFTWDCEYGRIALTYFFVCTVVCSKNLEWILGYCLRWSAVYPCQFLFLVNYWKLPVFWKDLKQICMYELLLYVLQHLHSRYVGSRPSRWQFSQFGWSTDRVERIKCDDMKYAGWFRTKLVSVHQTLELLRIIWPPWLHTVIWPWQHHRTGEHFSLESALASQLLSWQVQGQCVCDSSKLTLPISHKVSSDIYSFWDEHSGNL